ncbi:putative FBD-associated F-box protein [Citrus sinensis]|uniref:FBD-associated F-box protein n=1 Tax=Citrus sinensis TaxID=2711 RepID=A0ACB8P0U3_CITSI|nr:putative FBD-associated F-box protein [Citrus sinensis]
MRSVHISASLYRCLSIVRAEKPRPGAASNAFGLCCSSAIMKKARNLIDSKRKSRKSVAIKLGHDRISSLTDSVLCNILSFLPTDNAVGTSILSSRWRHVWTSLHTLLFDATVCIRQGDFTDVTMERFEMFVISVVLRTEPSNVQKFSLHSYRVSGSSRLKEWVSSAVMRDVRELELNIENQQRLELPESIYSCRSLQVLKLDSDFDIAVPGSGICFPNVKFLRFIMAPLIEILHVVDDLMVSYELVNAVLNCKNLTLSSGVMLALERANLSVLPSVPQLTHFEVHIGETGWRALPLILTSAPLLEKFVLVKECWVNACDPKFGWMENGCVPQCLAQHVKEIEIQGVEDVEDDVKLLEFFMKHCLVLQTMIIRCKRTVTNKKVNHLLRTV